MRHKLVTLTLPPLLLAACNSPSSISSPPVPSATDAASAASETPDQRASRLSVLSANANKFKVKVYGNGNPSLRAALAKLPPDRRDQPFILVDGNRIYSNNDQKLRELQQYVELEDGQWIDQDGFKAYLPPSEPKPTPNTISAQYNSPGCQGANSGPFIRNIAASGYSKFSGDVYLPTSANAAQNRKSTQTKEKIHLYSGGWGATGIAVDAGFQRNDTTRYQGFLKVEQKYAPADSQNGGYALGSSPQFVEGQTGSIDFYSFNDNSVHASLYGTDANGVYTAVTFQFNSLAGFTETGTGVEVKFMTSIAQQDAVTGAGRDDFTTGGYVNTQWSRMSVGNASTTKNWTQTSGVTAKTCPYPSTYSSASWLNSTTYKTTIQLAYVSP